jgi:hypothetical protein
MRMILKTILRKNKQNKKTNNNMRNTVMSIVAALAAFISPVYAGDTKVVAPVVENAPSGFTAKAFAASVIEDTDDYVFGGGLSLEVPLVYDLKLEVVGGIFEDQVYTAGANLVWYIPVSENISLYTLGGGAYEFETDQWVVSAGGGVKYSLDSRVSLFADGAYNWAVENDEEDGVVLVRVGVGFDF